MDGPSETPIPSPCNKGFIMSELNTGGDKTISQRSGELLSQCDPVIISVDTEIKLMSGKGSGADVPPKVDPSDTVGESNRVPADMSFLSKYGFQPKKDSSGQYTSQGASGGTGNLSMSANWVDNKFIGEDTLNKDAGFMINESLLRDTNLFYLSKISIHGDSGMSKD
jgi:hypothetical protein